MKHCIKAWLIAAIVAAGAVVPASAQGRFPDKPIRIIVPFPAGGAVDLIARLVSARITEEKGWAFIVENRAGAGGIIASEATAKAAPDGTTLLLTTPNHTINAALKPKLPYDTERDLVPITIVAAVPEILVAHPAVPFGDVKGLITYAKANVGKLNYSSAGNGTLPHITMELLLRLADIKVVHVPYRGAAPALTDLVAGVVQLKYDTIATSRELIAAGKLKALGYASAQRSKLLPAVPTIAEQGFPGYEGVLWNGLVAPAGTPQPVLDQILAAVTGALKAPALSERLIRDGIEPVGSTPAAFAALIKREIGQWRDLAKSVEIKLE